MSMLRSIREKKGLTLGQLAARASIPSRTLTEYEEGRQTIPLAHAKLIAKALWVQIEDLMPPAGSVQAASAPSYQPQAPRPAPAAPPAQPARPAPSPAPRMEPAGEGPGSQPAYAAPQQAAPGAWQGGQGPAPQQAPMHSGPREGHAMQTRPLGTAPGAGAKGGRTTRPARGTASPPKPISEGQTEELMRLAGRLEMDQQELEERLGKPLTALMRPEAKDWIKKLRDQANEDAPVGRVHYGQWPGGREDEEARYLGAQRDARQILQFKLFNGEVFTGNVVEFTPYTITVRTEPENQEMVVRKLAIVYYKQTGQTAAAQATTPASTASDASAQAAPQDAPAAPEPAAEPAPHAGHDAHASDVDSDRVGEPVSPEGDNMDEDRGV